MPFDVVATTNAVSSPDGNSPIILAVLPDGTTKSPQIAPECASLATDYSETSPPSLIQRRKQHTYVLFFFPLGGEVAVIQKSSEGHPNARDPEDPDSWASSPSLKARVLCILSASTAPSKRQSSEQGVCVGSPGEVRQELASWPVERPTGWVSVTVSREIKAGISAEGGSAQLIAGRETRHVCSSVIGMLILS